MNNAATTTAAMEPVRPRPFLAATMLAWREIIRFLRQRNRVIGAVGQPILFWLLFGLGLDRSFRLSDAGQSGQSFLEYYFPGTMVLILLFTAIFSTISVIEDRREGFLQSVLVAPIPRWSMVLGKVLGGSSIALAQSLVFLVLALTLGLRPGLAVLLQMTGLLAVCAVGLTSLGLLLAWRTDSVQGFHAMMNLCLFPLWLLSGAFFPVPPAGEGAGWTEIALHWAMRLDPLTYAVAGLRWMLYPDLVVAGYWMPSLAACWIVSLIFTGVLFAAAWFVAGQRTSVDIV